MLLGGLRLELPMVYYLLWIIPLPAVRRFMTLYTRLTAAGKRAVQNTKKAPKGSAKTFFSSMYPENGEQPFPDSLMAEEAGNIIVAGSDSRSDLFQLAFWQYTPGRNLADRSSQQLPWH